MSNTVSPLGRRAGSAPGESSLYAPNGARKYLNAAERSRALSAMQELPVEKALFALTLAWTGARISEVLVLTPGSFQVESSVVAIVTLKRRRFVVREVPIPPRLTAALERQFGLSKRPANAQSAHGRLWPWSRTTGWRVVKEVMNSAGIIGRQACPRGLRHAFGVATLQAGVPLNLTQTWLGHAALATTAIYAAVCGPEEQGFASRFWEAANALRETAAL